MLESTKQTVLCVAPHPDDETLGCGGALLKHLSKGDLVHWLIVTQMTPDMFSLERIRQRKEEIVNIAQSYGFSGVHELGFPSASLDGLPLSAIVGKIGRVLSDIQPTTVYVPYRGDIHSDHAVVFDAVAACSKWFRYPSVRKLLVYETPSETDFAINPDSGGFRPNVFVDIDQWLDRKLEIMTYYSGEQGAFPFPRSEESLRALARMRGSSSGFFAAEAFMLLRERC